MPYDSKYETGDPLLVNLGDTRYAPITVHLHKALNWITTRKLTFLRPVARHPRPLRVVIPLMPINRDVLIPGLMNIPEYLHNALV